METAIDPGFFGWRNVQGATLPGSPTGLNLKEAQPFGVYTGRDVVKSWVTVEEWQKAKEYARGAFYEEVSVLLNDCFKEMQELDRVVVEKFGWRTPGLAELKKSLGEVHKAVEQHLEEKHSPGSYPSNSRGPAMASDESRGKLQTKFDQIEDFSLKGSYETEIVGWQVIDVEALLAPIPGDRPSGEETRYSGLYDEVREARRAEDTLEQGDWKREPKVADWPHVKRVTLDALENRTKDLQICAWLTDALVRMHGFPGLSDGLKVMRGLHERFWESVYPEIEEDDDLEGRANTLSNFDRAIADALKSVAITRAPGLADVSYLQYEDSKQFDIPENLESLDSDTIERANALKAGTQKEERATSEEWRKAKKRTRRAFYKETYDVIDECWAEFQALDHVMDEKYGRQSPGLGELKKSLETIRPFVNKILMEKRISDADGGLLNQLKRLEDENSSLKQAVADLSLDNLMLNDVLSKKW